MGLRQVPGPPGAVLPGLEVSRLDRGTLGLGVWRLAVMAQASTLSWETDGFYPRKFADTVPCPMTSLGLL